MERSAVLDGPPEAAKPETVPVVSNMEKPPVVRSSNSVAGSIKRLLLRPLSSIGRHFEKSGPAEHDTVDYLKGLEDGERQQVEHIVGELDKKFPVFSEKQQESMKNGIAWVLQAKGVKDFEGRVGKDFARAGREVCVLPEWLAKKMTIPDEVKPVLQAAPEFLKGIADLYIAKSGVTGAEAAAVRAVLGLSLQNARDEQELLANAQGLAAAISAEVAGHGTPVPVRNEGIPVPVDSGASSSPDTATSDASSKTDTVDKPTDKMLGDNSKWAKFMNSKAGESLAKIGVALAVGATILYVLYFVLLYFGTRPGKMGGR